MQRKIITHLEEQNLLPAEKEGCHLGSKGCKDRLMISGALCEDWKGRYKTLSTAWTDYQKAFDSVPHSWVETLIESVGMNKL